MTTRLLTVLAAGATSGLLLASPAHAQCSKDRTASACSSGPQHVMLGAMGKADIVQTAIEAGSFETLVAAVQAAELVEVLQGDGPFTVFAPSDEAFAKIPAETLASLLKPENRDKLTAILTYHVVPGAVMAEEVVRTPALASVNGQRVDFKVEGGNAFIDDAKIVATDIACSNGVIHVIDTVIMPSMDDIVTTANSAGSFNTLLAAATKAGLAEALMGEGPFTVFAPTDEAFAKLPAGTIETLLKPENRDQLASILKYHVVAGRAFSTDAAKLGKAPTLLGQEIRFSARDGQLYVNDAKIVAADIDASNGVIHVIDSVILPK